MLCRYDLNFNAVHVPNATLPASYNRGVARSAFLVHLSTCVCGLVKEEGHEVISQDILDICDSFLEGSTIHLPAIYSDRSFQMLARLHVSWAGLPSTISSRFVFLS